MSRDFVILDKWAAKYGIKIQLDLINDYIESINLYTGGAYQGCVMTNMDALTIALIIGDFSNGNDGIVIKNGDTLNDLKGRRVKLVELSVSHYLLARALSMNNLKDIKLVNTSDADIAAVFAADKDGAVVTWNSPLMQCRNIKGAKMVFDSNKIPGEIIPGSQDQCQAALRCHLYENGGGREIIRPRAWQPNVPDFSACTPNRPEDCGWSWRSCPLYCSSGCI